jgi:hypothetical protein
MISHVLVEQRQLPYMKGEESQLLMHGYASLLAFPSRKEANQGKKF